MPHCTADYLETWWPKTKVISYFLYFRGLAGWFLCFSRCRLESWVACAADFSWELSWVWIVRTAPLHHLGPSLLLHTLSPQDISSFSTPAWTSFHGSWLLNELQQELRPRAIIGQKQWPILEEGRAACMYRAGKDLGAFTAHLCSPNPWLGSSSSYIHLYSFRMETSKKGSTHCVLGQSVITARDNRRWVLGRNSHLVKYIF